MANTITYSNEAEAHEWAPILQDANASSSANGKGENGNGAGKDIFSGSNGVVTLHVRTMSKVTDMDTLAQITRLSDEQVARYPALLNRFKPEQALCNDAILAYAKRDEKIVASVYGIREIVEGGAILKVANLVSDGSERGIGLPLTAALHTGDAHFHKAAVNGEAIARILPDGTVNAGSARVFTKLGFVANRFFTHPVTLENPQKGMAGSAEPHGGELKYLAFHGIASKIQTRAIGALINWNVKFG